MKLVQTKLPYDHSDLDPSISEETINYHYTELYGAYVKRFNNNEGDSDFNEAGAFLHDIYFTQFQSPESANKPTGPISEFINKHFKSFDNFKDQFKEEAMSVQGSGWVYLAKNGKIKTIVNHQIKNDIVLLIDWWEHAWALDYQSDKKSYLANQWKIINWNVISSRIGLAESTVSISFIKELHEARMIYKESDLKFTFPETCENLYLVLLTLEFLAHCKQTKSIAERYAKQTTSYYPYNEFRTNGTDLHNLMYFVSADPAKVEHIFNSPHAKEQRQRTHLPLMALNGYLNSLTNSGNRDIYFIMRVEQALGITNHGSKEIRRMISYHNPSDSDITSLSYSILNEFRNRMPMFDLMNDLSQHLSSKLTFDR